MIDVFPEEEAAFTLVSLLMWLLPTTVILGALLDFALFYLFSTKFHPWAGILSETQGSVGESSGEKEGDVVEKEQKVHDEQENKVCYIGHAGVKRRVIPVFNLALIA